MANVYTNFLSSPSTAALASNASLHYITTTTSIIEADAIIKHLQVQEKLVKKKSETVLSTIVGGNDIVVETETTYEFIRGGGALLPQMDDNMLVDSLVVLPMIHIVQLNSEGKISQIRLNWDQGTMLKQVDAIGRTGRNWPIRDGTAMASLIKSSASSVQNGSAPQTSSSSSVKADKVTITNRSGPAHSEYDQDFHTRLFDTSAGAVHESERANGPRVAVRESAKPGPRQYEELFPDGTSPDRVDGARPKTGSNKHFGANRLFDQDENAAADMLTPSPARKKAHPTKYNHFEFVSDANVGAQKHKNNTSHQGQNKVKPQNEHQRHIGPGIDEDQISPYKRPIVHSARPDAGAHFKLADEMSPLPQRQVKDARPDAFSNNFKTEGGMITADQKQPLGTNVNSSNIRRGPDINTHYTSTDASPKPSNDENARQDDYRQGGRNTKSASRTQNDKAHWGMDSTPEKVGKIYKTAGDGMGGRKDADRSWMTGDDQPVAAPKIYKTYGNGMGGRRDAAPSWSWGDRDDEVEEQQSKTQKIYKTAGDGMGSRKAQELASDHDF